MDFKRIVCFAIFLIGVPTLLFAAYGISIDGELKYPKNFTQFDYTSEKAVKGGTLVLHDIGGFDKMNPFTRKGISPYGLEELVFEPLAVTSLDEHFSEYGLIAEDIELAQDKLSVTYTLNTNAMFSDGSPITVADIAYTLKMLKSDKVHPFYPFYYNDITGSEIVGEGKIKFNFSKKNRELYLIATQMPIFSKSFYEKNGFGRKDSTSSGLLSPVGSGPYIVSHVNPGKSITYQRNVHHWAKDLPVRKGMYNFDTIIVKYYKDPVIALEAFKAGEFDFISINIAKQWARDMRGPKFTAKKITKKIFDHENSAGIQGFLMNTRRDLFKDRKVRQALGLAMDFEWINESLFHGQYERAHSFFGNSYLAATDLPEGLELEYLNEYRDIIPGEIFTTPLDTPTGKGKRGIRKNLRKATSILKEAGWLVSDGVLRNKRGDRFEFDILLLSPAFERIMASFANNLQKLGIKANYRTIDQALYTERVQKFDFDMIVASYGQSLSPGNEQVNFWHSSAAHKNGSKNFAGIQSDAVDGLVEKIIAAENEVQLTSACKALDRVLWYNYYLIPNWFVSHHRLGYYNTFNFPKTLPTYYNPFQFLMTWWKRPDA